MAKNIWINKEELLNKAKIKYLENNPKATKATDLDTTEEALYFYIHGKCPKDQ